ncbi:MAG: carboxypeptidase-like regulatory domain-containing protein [Flavobacterium sp.]|nr:carboxypeptidase-like regulatory domain-containing protein [Flavobacterium sp.]
MAVAQISGMVTDSISGKPVSYVNIIVENTPEAASSDDQGKFKIAAKGDQILIFSAVGYKSIRIKASNTEKVLLAPVVYELSEVSIGKPKQTISKILSDYNRKDIDLYYAIGDQPYMWARYFQVSDTLSETPYLKGLTIATESKVKGAKFNVHFLEVQSDGTPGAEIAQTNIIGVAKKGKRDTYIDLLPFKIQVPENGFFIALEALIVPENRSVEYAYTDKKGIFHENFYYSPAFATTRSEDNTSWGFRESHQWGIFKKVSQERIQKYYEDFKRSTGKEAPPFDERNVQFAMKVLVTN